MKIKTACLCILIVAGSAAFAFPSAAAGRNVPDRSADEAVLILFNGPPGAAQQELVRAAQGRIKYTYHLIPAIAAQLPPAAVEALRRHPDVLDIEPDALLHPFAAPNDPRYPELWGLHNVGQTGGTADADIDAPEAWEATTGSVSVVIADVDTGAQVAPGFGGNVATHPDLAANLWVNPDEVPGDRIDNDGNGYVDDIHGWNFYDNASWLFYSTSEDEHGTHTAGTIGAVGNNGVGVAGVNWQARVMILKFLGPNGGYTSDAIAAIQYASDKGARVINASWGGGPYSDALKAAIEASGCVFVAAAGNGGPDQVGDNNDATPSYPASYDSANIVAVAATDHKDSRASFSNYGATSVDLGAPGVGILSTVPMSSYASYSGTSMATPHVTGVAGLILSVSPDLTPAEVKQQILSTVDAVPALSGITVTGGRLNAAAAVGTAPPPPSSSTALAQSETTVRGTVGGSYTDTHASDDSYELLTEVRSSGKSRNRYSTLEHRWTFNVLKGTTVTFRVEARRADNADGDNFLFSYSTNGTSFTSLPVVVNSPVEQVYSAPLPAGTSGTVYVRVNDTDSTKQKVSLDSVYIDHLSIESAGTVNTAPVVNITSPANGSTWNVGASIGFAGTANDAEDGALTGNLRWVSNINGVIGTGAGFTTSSLSAGTHTINASVTDSGGKTGNAFVSITVGSPQTGPPLYVEVGTDANTYVSGEYAWIEALVMDDFWYVEGAAVHAVLRTPNGTVYSVDGLTDAFGGIYIIHDINAARDGTGTYVVEATASKTGYQDGFGSTTFTVTR